jgi:hypothetical protein
MEPKGSDTMRSGGGQRTSTTWLLGVVVLLATTGCVTVKATQRSVLADPIMQFEGDPQSSAQFRHAVDNREGSYGGSGVSGGGCGCN